MKKLVFAMLLVICVAVLAIGCGKTNQKSDAEKKDDSTVVSKNIPDGMKEYYSDKYKLKLFYPEKWTLNESYGERYEYKNDGFFTIVAITGSREDNVMTIAKGEGEHTLEPFGADPKYESVEVDGEPGVKIIPSPDQSKEMAHQYAVVIKYPQPIELKDEKYSYVEIVTDKEHFEDIVASIKFVRQ